MPLEANRIQLVAPAEVRMCELCGSGPIPDRLPYITFNNKSGDDFAPGLIHTVDEQPASTAYRLRDQSGQTAVTVVHNPQLCRDCVARAAELIGYGDRTPLLAEPEQLDEQLHGLRERLEQTTREKDEAEAACRELEVRVRILAGEAKSPAAAKRPPRAKV